MSTNKVYGDAPNGIRCAELETRWDYADPAYAQRHRRDLSDRPVEALAVRRVEGRRRRDGAGVRPLLRHADLLPARRLPDRPEPLRRRAARLPQLPGRSATSKGSEYKVFGYKGKQVRDNIHSLDVARFIDAFFDAPRVGEVYNLGGGTRQLLLDPRGVRGGGAATGKPMRYEYVDKNREGDHICYISDLTKMRTHYPEWDVTVPLSRIFEEIVDGWRERASLHNA